MAKTFISSILPESPRWLLTKNRNEEAFEILTKVAKDNKRQLSEQTWEDFIQGQQVCTITVEVDRFISRRVIFIDLFPIKARSQAQQGEFEQVEKPPEAHFHKLDLVP